jgi:hypothetical protein
MFNAYWRVILSTGKKLSKYDQVTEPRGERRQLDWTLDLVSTGDVFRIKELCLAYPFMRSVTLGISEPGTAFQFCRQVKGMDLNTGQPIDQIEAQVIGKVVNKEEGLCDGYIWDRVNGLLGYQDVSIYDFPSWRPGLMPPGRLNLDVLGVRL